MIKNYILRKWYRLIKKSPASMPMVRYWKFQEKVEAKVTTNKDGALVMHMDGEDEVFPGFPRGYLLFGKLSKLKHEIKNRIFNDSWWALEAGKSEKEVVERIKGEVFEHLFVLAEETQYDRVPYSRMIGPVKEIYRAWTKVARSERSKKLRDILCFVLQEDDGYRFRCQWLVTWFNTNRWYMRLFGKDPVKQFDRALSFLEHGEVIGDMKEKARLLRRILMVGLRDKSIREQFIEFCREVDWNKVALTRADKYHFRGKYFKVDYDLFEY